MKKKDYWTLFWATGLPEAWLRFRFAASGD